MSAALPPIIQSSPHYRADIDGLRGIAVLWVVAYHFFPTQFPAGFAGVDVFFVISGYLITGHLLETTAARGHSLISFYQRRAVRLLPTLLLVVAATFIAGWFNFLPAQFKSLGLHVAAGAGFVANLVLWQESGYFGGDAALKPMLHLWSLAIEEQFYLIWPLLLWALARFKPFVMPLALLLITMASFVANIWVMQWDKSAAFYWPITRFWELSLGALLAYWQARPNATSFKSRASMKWVPQALAGLGLLLLLITASRLTPQRPFPGTWALLPTLGAWLLIAAGPKAWVNRNVLSHGILRGPGLISYAWYLWHWPLLAFAHLELGEALPAKVKWGMLLLSLILAVVCTYGLERPLRFGAFWKRHRAALTGTLVIGLIAVGYAGWNVYERDGLAFRLPNMIRKMTDPPVDMFAGWGRGTCLLESHLQASDYQAACVEDKRPLVFVWGDSHAAALMPGLKAVRDSLPPQQRFGLAQRTGATCPPFPQVADVWCNSLNQDTIALIRKLKPEIVILHAFWSFDFYDLPQLTETVSLLKQAGVGRVVVIGAPPGWQPPLPQQILKAWEQGAPALQPPFRLKEGVTPATFAREAHVATLAQGAGAQYLSMVEWLCTEQGCQTRDRPNSDHILSHDYGHLSYEGAVWVAGKILPEITMQK